MMRHHAQHPDEQMPCEVVARSRGQRLWSALRHAYRSCVLEGPGAESSDVRFGTASPGFAEFERGAQVVMDAQHVGEGNGRTDSVLLLYRAAAVLFINAWEARGAGSSSKRSAPEDLWASLRELSGSSEALTSVIATHAVPLRRMFAAEWEETYLSGLSTTDSEAHQAAIKELAFALGDPLAMEIARPRRRMLIRCSKTLGLVAVLLGIAVCAVSWALSSPNLALNQRVLVESSSREYVVDPRHVVDGDRMNLGFHTESSGPKRVTIDLLAVRRLRRVDVYNRLDCCHDRAVPLSLEVSTDGESFRAVAERKERFVVWKADIPSTEARYVRLVQRGRQPFHLSEVEIY
jgi:hypothetical protein